MTQTGPGTSLLDRFAALTDPRQVAKVLFPLPEILLLVLAATLAGADDFVEVQAWGEERLTFLRRFLPYGNGIPSHDTLNGVLNALDPELFQHCFVTWVDGLRTDRAGIRRHRRQDLAPLPCSRQGPRGAAPRLGLGQPPAAGARPGGGCRQVERDHGHPAAARAARARRCSGHHRRHRLSDQDRPGDPGQAGRLPPGREDQLARAPCRDRALLPG